MIYYVHSENITAFKSHFFLGTSRKIMPCAQQQTPSSTCQSTLTLILAPPHLASVGLWFLLAESLKCPSGNLPNSPVKKWEHSVQRHCAEILQPASNLSLALIHTFFHSVNHSFFLATLTRNDTFSLILCLHSCHHYPPYCCVIVIPRKHSLLLVQLICCFLPSLFFTSQISPSTPIHSSRTRTLTLWLWMELRALFEDETLSVKCIFKKAYTHS